METRNVQLSESIKRVDEVQALLQCVDGRLGEFVQAKLNTLLAKNEGLHVLRQVCAILNGETTSQPDDYNFTAIEIAAFNFAPLVSVDAERSFSRYKAFLRENRLRFNFEHIRQHIILYFND